MCLQEAVEVLPGLGDPVDDLNQVIAAHVLIDLCLYQLPPQETAQETFDRLSVVGAQHPPTSGQIIDGETKAVWLIKHFNIKPNFSSKQRITHDVTCAVPGISTISINVFWLISLYYNGVTIN